MRIISGLEVEQKLDMRSCIGLMKDALIALSEGDGRQIVRPVVPFDDNNLLGMMPAYLASRRIAGVKVLAVFPENYLKGMPSHLGQILVFETETGKVTAVVEAGSVTGIRTAAASAAVTQVLARRSACKLAILGAGLQGRSHLEAVSLVRDLEEVTVWDVRPEASRLYADEMGKKTGLPVHVSPTARGAVKDADIICTVTPSEHPIISATDVKPGAHINAVGACAPNVREISSDLMAKGRLFVDWKTAALLEAGDYLLAVKDGAISQEHILGEVGEVLSGKLAGRLSEDDVTIFESLGQAIQDLMAADFVIRAIESDEKANYL